MNFDSPLDRIPGRGLLVVGLLCDALVPVLYYALEELSYSSSLKSGMLGVLELAMVFLFFGGIVGTTIGSWLWARRASNTAVAVAAGTVVLLTLLGANLAGIGFDDPRIVILPFGLVVVILLVIGRAMGQSGANRNGLWR